MNRLLRLLVCLSLVFSLIVPAFALEGEQNVPPAFQEQDYVETSCQDGTDVEVPIWQEMGYTSLAEYLVYEGLSPDAYWIEDMLTDQERQDQTFTEEYLHVRGMFINRYAEQHPDWFADLDYDRLFEIAFLSSYYSTPEEYREREGLTPEQYREELQYQWALERRRYERLALEIEAFAQEHPASYAAFDPEEYLQTRMPWLESLDALAESYYISPDEAALMMAENWMYDEIYYGRRLADWEAFYAEHPYEAENFNAEAYFYGSYHAEWYGTPEEYRRERGQTQEQFFLEMAQEWMSGRTYRYDYAQEIRNLKLALGGNPDGVDVMLNGAFVSFPDVGPELSGGRTMAPMNHTLVALGAQVTYLEEQHAVSALLPDGATLVHEIGTTVLTRTPAGGGEGETVRMDVQSYVKDGRTMIPVSFFADAMGYTVGWDRDYQTAVLVDKTAMAKELDETFSLLGRVWNQVVRWQPEQEGSALSVTGDFRGAVTMPGADGKSNRYTFGVTTELLESDSGQDLKLDSDLSDLIRLYRDTLIGYGMGEDEYAQGLEEIRELLTRAKLEVIANYDSGIAYLRSGLVDYIVGRASSAWYSLPFEDNLPQYLDLGSVRALRGMSFGEVMTQLLVTDAPTVEGWFDATTALSDLMLLADDQFQQNNGVYTFTYTDPVSYYSQQSVTLRITPEGEGCSFQLNFRQEADNDDFTERGTLQISGEGDTLKLELEYLNYDGTAFELTGEITRGETTKLPRKAPPPGLEIVPLDELYGY